MNCFPTPVHRVAVTALLCFLGLSPVFAQQTGPTEGDTLSAPPEIQPIPSARIIDRALETAELLRRVEESRVTAGEAQKIQDTFAARQQQVEELQEETRRRLEMDGPASVIAETEREWSRVQARFDGWLRVLESRAASLGSLLEQVQAEKAVWRRTREATAEEDLPPELERAVRETIEDVEGAERELRSTRNEILNLQATIGQAKAQADAILAEQRQTMRERSRTLLAADSPFLWTALREPGAQGSIAEQISASWHSGLASVRAYAAESRAQLLGYLLTLSGLVAVLFFLRRKAQVWVQQDRSLGLAVDLLERPIAAGLILIVLLCWFLDPSSPQAWNAVLGLLFLAGVLRLLPRVLPAMHRSWTYVLAGLFLMQQTALLTQHGATLNRLVLLLLSLAGLVASVWLAREAGRARSDLSKGWLGAIRLVTRLAATLFGIGAIANIVGSVGLALIVITGTLRSLLAVVVLLVAVVLMQALVRVVMLVRPVRSLGIVAQRGEITRRTLFRGIRMAAVVAWIVVTLRGFLALDPVLDRLGALLGTSIPLGSLSLAPADILVFVLATWVSFKVARLLSFVLETDVLPHMELPRGVPGAVTRLSRYVVIVIGVLIAISAAGFPLDKVTIVFGALGVGIGFGLQNIVNNFVSGLILLFERPIQVGDMVQLATFEGTVEDIGIRASTIRSYSGAEIVVPNANLVSAEVVNWTLRDRGRRVEIPVGVAYGTDPGSVIEILADVAARHEEVSKEPGPQVLFRGFGDSSLDFELRAWTHVDRFLRVSSELRLAVVQALREAGIEIPFPQRDLHVRSLDDRVIRALREKAER